jgi:hypothetical protein
MNPKRNYTKIIFRLLLALQFTLSASLGYSTSNDSLENYSTAVFQVSGLNGEGLHPVFVSHSSNTEIAQALAKVYHDHQVFQDPIETMNASSSSQYPQTIFILVPDTLVDKETEAYLESIRNDFAEQGLTNLNLKLITVPVHELVEQSTPLVEAIDRDLLASTNLSDQDQNVLSGFKKHLQSKVSDLIHWADHIKNWRSWKSKIQSQWSNFTTREKDKTLLILFGAARGLPGVGIYAHDAGGNIINIARMAIAYAADIFFTVAPQKLADLPTKMRLPELKSRTQAALSWASSLGLMSLGYYGIETEPAQIYFQISNASAYVKEWFDRSIELKSFLLNYSLSLGIPLTFLTLGYFAKGGAGSGALSPFDISFLLEFAGLQLVDGFMGMFSGRGTRVITEKGYISGRQENILYSIFNLLGQAQGLGVATGHPLVYKSCLAVKSVLQGLLFLVSRILPAKTPNIFIFHSQIGEKEIESYLYVQGILDPQKLKAMDYLLEQVRSESQGPTPINRWLGKFGQVFLKNQWSSQLISPSHRCADFTP